MPCSFCMTLLLDNGYYAHLSASVDPCCFLFFFFFNDTATTEIYTLSLHDALPISRRAGRKPSRRARVPFATLGKPVGLVEGQRDGAERGVPLPERAQQDLGHRARRHRDRKSTRLNSSHANISYAVFCLKKKKENGAVRTAVALGISVGSAGKCRRRSLVGTWDERGLGRRSVGGGGAYRSAGAGEIAGRG